MTHLPAVIRSRTALALFCFGVLGVSVESEATSFHRYQYLSPVPDAKYVSSWNNLIIRHGERIDAASVSARYLSVIGSVSGAHSGRMKLADDGRTILFTPDEPFAAGEGVEVNLKPGIRTRLGRKLPSLEYRFTVSSYGPGRGRQRGLEEAYPEMAERFSLPVSTPRSPERDSCECLPEEYPEIDLLSSNRPGPGHLFVTPFSFTGGRTHLAIIDNDGLPIYYRTYGSGIGMDFKRQPTGVLSAFVRGRGGFVVYDSSYVEIAQYQAGNGYAIDFHGLQLLPNGHALVQVYDPQAVRMDLVVPGGRPDAVVIGFIIQELDAERNVVFQWRSWDHMEITDLAAPHIALTDSAIDYVHGNSVELDHDGHLLISSRHLNEVTKISRETGDILWRMGRHARKNEFRFLNDPRGFSHQHDARRLPNGNITVYDNGVGFAPEYSRALEYSVNEETKVALLVWEYREVPDIYAGFLGNVQKREDGSATIGWGGSLGNPNVTDLHPDGTKALEVGFGPGYMSYRAYRFPWRTNRFLADPEVLDFRSVSPGASLSLPLTIRNNTPGELTIDCLLSTDSAFSVPGVDSLVLGAGGSETVQVRFAPDRHGKYESRLHLRQVSRDELVAQTVLLKGEGGGLTISEAMEDRQHRESSTSLRLVAGEQNPIRSSASIRFELSRASRVLLQVFDVRGRRVATLVDGVYPSGSHSVLWTPRKKRSGIYFYRLQQGDTVITEKVVLLPDS